MALIIILIAYYFDYKSEKESFLNDLKGGVFVCLILLCSALFLKYIIGLGLLYVICSIGVEIILIFVAKGFLNKEN